MSTEGVKQPAAGADNDLNSGTWYKSACSGLWYRKPGAAGDVMAIKIDGRYYEVVVAAADDLEQPRHPAGPRSTPAHGSASERDRRAKKCAELMCFSLEDGYAFLDAADKLTRQLETARTDESKTPNAKLIERPDGAPELEPACEAASMQRLARAEREPREQVMPRGGSAGERHDLRSKAERTL